MSGDIRDEDLINKLTKDVEKIFHLAALIGIPYSYTAPGLILILTLLVH